MFVCVGGCVRRRAAAWRRRCQGEGRMGGGCEQCEAGAMGCRLVAWRVPHVGRSALSAHIPAVRAGPECSPAVVLRVKREETV